MNGKVPMTVSGIRKLREELDRLINQERPRITQAVATARAHGDLKENAEYHAAREQQSFAEGRIQNIEAKLSTAEVIDITKINAGGRVVFGATVKIFDDHIEEEVVYRIVGEDEADLEKGMISYTSPIARAMIGKQMGDSFVVEAPSGDRPCELLEVLYEHWED